MFFVVLSLCWLFTGSVPILVYVDGVRQTSAVPHKHVGASTDQLSAFFSFFIALKPAPCAQCNRGLKYVLTGLIITRLNPLCWLCNWFCSAHSGTVHCTAILGQRIDSPPSMQNIQSQIQPDASASRDSLPGAKSAARTTFFIFLYFAYT